MPSYVSQESQIRSIRSESTVNELGRLFQGVERNEDGSKRTKGTNTSFFISREKNPNTTIKDITYARVVCTIREMKKDKYRTRTTAGGSDLKH